MGGSFSKNDSSSGSDFNQDVWGPQGDALQDMWGQLSGLFGNTMGGMDSQMGGATDWMNSIRDQSQPFWQDQMKGGAYQGMDLQNQYNQALGGGGNEQFIDQSIMGGAGNDYADAMKGQVMQHAGDLQNQMLAGTDARAAASGMSGGSRHGTAQAQGMKDINQQATNQLGQIGYNTFDKDLDRKLGIAQRADQFDMNKLGNISGMLGQQQNTMNQGLAGSQGMQNLGMGAFSPYMMPWQAAGAYGNILGGPTVLGSGSSSADSGGMGVSGGVGGK